jgi:hypothetical protein
VFCLYIFHKNTNIVQKGFKIATEIVRPLLDFGHEHKRTSPPTRRSMGTIYLPILLLTRCAWCPPDPSLFSLENKDRVAWFRQPLAQVRALQPTPGSDGMLRLESNKGSPHRSLFCLASGVYHPSQISNRHSSALREIKRNPPYRLIDKKYRMKKLNSERPSMSIPDD